MADSVLNSADIAAAGGALQADALAMGNQIAADSVARDNALSGRLTPVETKLATVQNNATANQSDATLKDRANHTGAQAISTVTGLSAALAALAPLASPALSGTPTAPTPAAGDNSTRIATMAALTTAIQAIVGLAPADLNTLAEIAARIAADDADQDGLVATVGGKLAKTANLSDLTDVAAARINLGFEAGWQREATGTGVSQTLTLPESLPANSISLYINGLRSTNGYSVVGTTLTFTAPLGASVLAERPTVVGPSAEAPVSGGPSLPPGGATGQILAKASATDGDAVWVAPPAVVPNVSAWPVLVAEFNGSQSVGNVQFAKITLSATADSANGWDAANSWWTVPVGQGGTYEIAGKIRLADGTGAGVSVGIGMHTSNADHPAFFWDNTKNNRQGMQNVRVTTLTAGQQVRLFAYIDAGAPVACVAAVLTIQRIR